MIPKKYGNLNKINFYTLQNRCNRDTPELGFFQELYIRYQTVFK